MGTWWNASLPTSTASAAPVALPTPRPSVRFSFDAFQNNPQPRIVQIGTWLRKLHAIHDLPVTMLKPSVLHQHKPYIADLFKAERSALGLAIDTRHVETLPFLDNDSYDELLRANIVFLDLYGASANNAIVECMVRATPVLVNPLPAVKEYLGPDYPLYFASRTQAARMAEDPGRIRAAHDYLRELPQSKTLDEATFAAAIAESDMYDRLPTP